MGEQPLEMEMHRLPAGGMGVPSDSVVGHFLLNQHPTFIREHPKSNTTKIEQF
jgi:hypothetical protein